jgi:hypothetical protein
VLRLRGSTRQSQLLIRPGGCFGTHDNNASWCLRNARPLGLDQNRQSPVLSRLISRVAVDPSLVLLSLKFRPRTDRSGRRTADSMQNEAGQQVVLGYYKNSELYVPAVGKANDQYIQFLLIASL